MNDRLMFARDLVAGRRVLDIGGSGMKSDYTGKVRRLGLFSKKPPHLMKFGLPYQSFRDSASEYKALDISSDAHYQADLNSKLGLITLEEALKSYKPNTITAMEVFEHVTNISNCLAVIADYMHESDAELFITLPNNANWIFNAMGFNHDHVYAFFPDIADRMIHRSPLAEWSIERVMFHPRYMWWWRAMYLASGCQPSSIGFVVNRRN